MSWVFGAIAVTMGVVFLWGLFAPRSQWRTLSAWVVSNPAATEPGGATYAWRRVIAGIGVIGLLVVGFTAYSAYVASRPRPGPPPTAIEEMWDAPTPRLVDRIVEPLDAPPAGLVEEPLLGFQDLDGEHPDYLRLLPRFSLLGDADVPGYIGSVADRGVSPTGASSLVVNVRGPLLCIPRQAVVIETDTAVQIAVYYGLPDPLSGPAPDHTAGCPVSGVTTGSLLIPLALSAPIGERVVQNLAGEPIREVAIVD